MTASAMFEILEIEMDDVKEKFLRDQIAELEGKLAVARADESVANAKYAALHAKNNENEATIRAREARCELTVREVWRSWDELQSKLDRTETELGKTESRLCQASDQLRMNAEVLQDMARKKAAAEARLMALKGRVGGGATRGLGGDDGG